MFCNSCGAKNEDGSRFCRECGNGLQTPATRLPTQPEPDEAEVSTPDPVESAPAPEPAQRVCPKCGSVYDDGMLFCAQDGTKLEPAVSVLSAAELEAEPEAEMQPVADAEPAPDSDANLAPDAPEEAETEPTDLHEEAETEEADPPEAPAANQVENTEEADPVSTPPCQNCGAPLEDGASFCMECGTRVSDQGQTQAEPQPEPKASEPPASEPEPPAVALPVAPLTQAPIAADVDPEPADVSQDFDQPDMEPFYEDERPASNAGKFALIGVLIAALMLGGGAGYYYWDKITAAVQPPSEESEFEAPASAAPVIPRVAGTYTAFLMDQEIEIEFVGAPSVLAEAAGTARYVNTINGGRCTSRLVAIESGGIGGDTSAKVLFSQQAVDGEPACSADIPVLIDINDEARSDDGVVESLAVEWKAPGSDEILMSGDLTRATLSAD